MLKVSDSTYLNVDQIVGVSVKDAGFESECTVIITTNGEFYIKDTPRNVALHIVQAKACVDIY